MGAAASIESQDPFVLNAKKSYEQTEKFLAKLKKMAIGDMTEEKMMEISTDMSTNDMATQVTIKLGHKTFTGNGMEAMKKSGEPFIGCKIEKSETSNIGVVMNKIGNITTAVITQDTSFGENGQKLSGFQLTHSFTWNEEGKIAEWACYYDSQAWEAAKVPAAASPVEAPIETAPLAEGEASIAAEGEVTAAANGAAPLASDAPSSE